MSVDNALFVFVDESGNFDFSALGTRHFVMSAVAATAPLESASILHNLRYRLLTEGHDVSEFHATEDRQHVRDRVFESFNSVTNVVSHVLYVDKREVSSQIRTDSQLHLRFGRAMIRHVIDAFEGREFEAVVVVFDQALTQKKQGAFRLAMKPELKQLSKPFHIYFHRMVTDMNGQIADYIAWSKFVALERGEQRPWKAVVAALNPSEMDLSHLEEQK